MLNHQYNPKLNLAEEKVNSLKDIVTQKQEERDKLEQLKILNRHIEKFHQTKYQLQKRAVDHANEIEDLKSKCEDARIDIDDTSEQLLALNKKNLKETYVLEDLQEDLDRLKAEREMKRAGNVTFMTLSEKDKNRLPPQVQNRADHESYAALEKINEG